MVIEKAAGMPFEHFVQTRILGPLQLNHTGYDDAKQVLEHRASGYVLTEGKLENTDPVDASVPWSAGGFYSTIGDLSVWMQSLVQGRLLNTQSTDLMFHAYPETLLQGVHYGYGIVLGERFGHRLEYYAGGIDGFSSVLQLYPDVDLNLIVMSNLDPRTASAPAWTVADGLAAVILGK